MFFNTKKRKIIGIIALAIVLMAVIIFGYFYYFSWKHIQAVKLADQAIVLIYEGSYDEAEEALDEALKKVDPDNKIAISRIYKNLAILYENTGETDLVAENYLKAHSLFDETESEYYSFLAQVDLLERDLNDAVDNFRKALEIDSDNFDAHNNLGLLFMGQLIYGVEPNYEMALVHNKRAFELEESIQTMQNLAVNYYMVGEYDLALPLLIKLDVALENDALTKSFIGLIYFNKRDYLPANIFLSKAVELDPLLKTEEMEFILEESKKNLSEILGE
ncbi:tetratricopeptide repeat protein [Patescibacteria group bacterium]|nr:tetratricopeptide repeat protein [Patescibacteria group bacterium]MBU1683458.1 tetratricopeptide repeat protein [Patescibacteria group bacterium]